MPWGTIIIGAFLCGGATMAIPHFVTGTSSIDDFMRLGVPISLFAIFSMLLVFGIFGEKH